MQDVDPRHLAELNRLVQHDAEMIATIDQALDDLDDEAVVELLRGFRADHERHIADLAQAISALGGLAVVPDRLASPGAGRLKPARTLLAMLRSHQYRACALHEAVASLALPVAAWRVVERNLEDERRHLDILEALLRPSSSSEIRAS